MQEQFEDTVVIRIR